MLRAMTVDPDPSTGGFEVDVFWSLAVPSPLDKPPP